MKKAEGDLLFTAWQKVEEVRAILEYLISTGGDECRQLHTVSQALEESSNQIIKQFRTSIEFGENARSNEDAFK